MLLELVTLRANLFGFSGNAGHLLRGHSADGKRGEDVVQNRHQLGLNDFDGHVVHKPFESHLPSWVDS